MDIRVFIQRLHDSVRHSSGTPDQPEPLGEHVQGYRNDQGTLILEYPDGVAHITITGEDTVHIHALMGTHQPIARYIALSPTLPLMPIDAAIIDYMSTHLPTVA